MKILLIDQHAGTPSMGGSLRSFTLAREWRKEGDQVTILSASHTPRRRRNPENVQPTYTETIDGVEFVFVPTDPVGEGPGEQDRSVYAFSWELWRQAKTLARNLCPQAVVLSSGHPFDVWGGVRLAKGSGASLFFDLREPWPELQGEIYGAQDGRGTSGARRAMRRALVKSARVLSPMQDAEDYLHAYGVPAHKLRRVPEPAPEPEEEAPLSLRNRDYLERLRRCYNFIIMYQGPVSRRKQLGLLAEAVKLLEEKGVAAVIIGNGDYKISLKRKIRGLAAAGVYLMDDIGEEAASAARYADCIYYGERLKLAVRYGAFGEGLLTRMRMGKPMLTALRIDETPSELAKGGVNAAEPSAASLAGAIEALRAMDRQTLHMMGDALARQVRENHDPARCAWEYRAALKEAARPRIGESRSSQEKKPPEERPRSRRGRPAGERPGQEAEL